MTRNEFNAVMVSVILEVAAGSRDELATKLYGPENTTDSDRTPVGSLIDASEFNSHPVMYRANTDYVGDPDEMSEIPHFNHGASYCDDVDACKNDPDSGGVYRTHDVGNLILKQPNDDIDVRGRYRLRDDVIVKLLHPQEDPTPGEQCAIRVA